MSKLHDRSGRVLERIGACDHRNRVEIGAVDVRGAAGGRIGRRNTVRKCSDTVCPCQCGSRGEKDSDEACGSEFSHSVSPLLQMFSGLPRSANDSVRSRGSGALGAFQLRFREELKATRGYWSRMTLPTQQSKVSIACM